LDAYTIANIRLGALFKNFLGEFWVTNLFKERAELFS